MGLVSQAASTDGAPQLIGTGFALASSRRRASSPLCVYPVTWEMFLIVKSDPTDAKTLALGQAEASAVTRGAVAQQHSMQDPWAAAAARLPSAQPTGLSSAQISSLEASITQRVLQQVQSKDY